MARLAGVELGGTKAIVALGEGSKIHQRVRIPVTGPEQTLRLIREQLAVWNREQPIEALGIASFGPVGVRPDRPDYGYVLKTPKRGWEGTNLLAGLGEGLTARVALHTDVTAAALAEGHSGAARDCADFIYMTVGTGIGVGIIASHSPIAGQLHPEAGHIMVRRLPGDNFAGSCPIHGDCLEGLASGSAIAARTSIPGGDVDDSDPVWVFVIDALAQACSTFFLTLASERIVLGGGVINSRRWLADAIAVRCADKLDGYLPFIANRAPIDSAELGQDAGPTGSLLLAEMALGKMR